MNFARNIKLLARNNRIGYSIRKVHSSYPATKLADGETAPCKSKLATYDVVNTFSNRIFHPFLWTRSRMQQLKYARDGYLACSKAVEDNDLFREKCQLPESFQSWFAITALHMWMCHARLRGEGEPGNAMYRGMMEHIWVDVEIKLHDAGVNSRMSSIMKQVVNLYHGMSLSFDEGLSKGDDILAAALWRNVFNCNPNVLPSQVYPLLEYIHREISRLDKVPREDLLLGQFQFSI